MNVLGIDPSYTCTGIAYAQGETRSIRSHPGQPAIHRRRIICAQLAPAMKLADIIAVEGLYPVVQAGFLDRAYLLGAIIDQAYRLTEAPILLVAPASPKILATGNGGPTTDKPAMLAAALDQRSQATNGDEADAWWIAELASLLTDPTTAGRALLRYGPTRTRALNAYRAPYAKKTGDPWIRPPKDRP